ncbi:hypothetical protein Mapa_010720 [Marchantia paleacea]|nr:hypothetical protein Mapa_010720 [Marchantia paleacea]
MSHHSTQNHQKYLYVPNLISHAQWLMILPKTRMILPKTRMIFISKYVRTSMKLSFHLDFPFRRFNAQSRCHVYPYELLQTSCQNSVDQNPWEVVISPMYTFGIAASSTFSSLRCIIFPLTEMDDPSKRWGQFCKILVEPGAASHRLHKRQARPRSLEVGLAHTRLAL